MASKVLTEFVKQHVSNTSQLFLHLMVISRTIRFFLPSMSIWTLFLYSESLVSYRDVKEVINDFVRSIKYFYNELNKVFRRPKMYSYYINVLCNCFFLILSNKKRVTYL